MRILSKALIFIVVFAFTFVLGLGIAGLILEDKIVELSIEQINKQLNVKINIKEVKVSLISGFPKALVRMKGVEIIEGSLDTPHELEPGLLSLEEITLKIGLLGLINNHYSIDELILKDGWINLYFDSSGKGNFDIFEKKDDNQASWLLDLDVFKLDNINLSYIDLRTGWIFKGFVDDANVKGKVSRERVLLNIKANGAIGSLRQGSFFYIRNQKARISTTFLVSPEAITLNQSETSIGNTELVVKGEIGRERGDPVNIDISGENLGVETLVSFLSQYNFSIPSKTRTQGEIAFSFNLNGYSKTEEPFNISLNFASEAFSIKMPSYPLLSISNFKGSFTNGYLGIPESSEVNISSIILESGSSRVQGTLKIKNILSPLYHLKVDQDLNVTDFNAWGVDIPLVSGRFNGPLEVLGILEDVNKITIASFENSKFYSNISVSDLTFKQVGKIPDLKDISGNISINNQDVTGASFKGKLHDSNFDAEIQSTNALGILLGNKKAIINASIIVDSLNTQWLLAKDQNSTSSLSEESTWDRIHSVSGDIFIDELVHNKFTSRPLSANFYLKSDQLFCNSFLSRSCDGIFTGRFSSHTIGESSYILSADIDAEGVNITKLFESFDNFGQQTITSSNISGRLDGSILFSTPIQNGLVIKKDLDANANVRITDGRLTNVKHLESLSRFIELDELKDIRFSIIENSIRVNGEQVIIPQMDIESSALNLSLSGIHTFIGEYTYRFQLLLSDVLFSKASAKKPENNSFGQVEDDETGRTKIFLKLEGDSNSQKVSYDGAAARIEFRENLKQEKESLKNILLDEFKFLRKQKTKSDTVIQGNSEISSANKKILDSLEKKKQPPKYTIEWDDE